ncbi:hypothetical protein FKP32DRAFT_1591453 [Trametes sanguinea]|nr:hypothetical protein FKP32DRAFT_1591453 [Trametes sanguinea]
MSHETAYAPSTVVRPHICLHRGSSAGTDYLGLAIRPTEQWCTLDETSRITLSGHI